MRSIDIRCVKDRVLITIDDDDGFAGLEVSLSEAEHIATQLNAATGRPEDSREDILKELEGLFRTGEATRDDR